MLGQELGRVNTVVRGHRVDLLQVDFELSSEGSRGGPLTSRRHAVRAEGVVNHVRGLNSTVTDLEALAVEHGAKVVTFDADLEPFGAYVVVPT